MATSRSTSVSRSVSRGVSSLAVGGRVGEPAVLPQHQPGQPGREHGVAQRHPSYGVEQLVARRRLHQVAGRAGLDRLEHVVLLAARGQDQHPDGRVLLDHLGGHRDPVGLGDLQVEHEHVGPRGREPGDRLGPVGRRRDHVACPASVRSRATPSRHIGWSSTTITRSSLVAHARATLAPARLTVASGPQVATAPVLQRLVVLAEHDVSIDRATTRSDQPTVSADSSSTVAQDGAVDQPRPVVGLLPLAHPERPAGRGQLPGEGLGEVAVLPLQQVYDGPPGLPEHVAEVGVGVEQRRAPGRARRRRPSPTRR